MTTEVILTELEHVREASRLLVGLSEALIAEIIREVADLAWERRAAILAANQQDLDRMDPADPKYDRLQLNEQRLRGILDDMRRVADMASPLGEVLEKRILPNGLELSRVRVPIGVIAIVFESRPNVTFDVFALCFKTGNACVLKGSRDARESNAAIVAVMKEVLQAHGIADTVYLAPAEREALLPVLQAVELIDCVIPRGSQGLIDFVRKNAIVPVIETGAGIVHTYVDASADLGKAKAIVRNAKTRRVSVCNSLDTLLVHESRTGELAEMLLPLQEAHVQLFADEEAFEALHAAYDPALLHHAKAEDFGVEWLDYKMSVKVVKDLDAALEHIAHYSSRHSEAVIAEDPQVIDRFLTLVDAACVYANASTAFSDGGEFGLGAEIGISTQKLHARGPMGLQAITSYKWLVRGTGQVR